MQKSKWLNSLLALLVVFISFSAFTGDFETEEDLIKTANKHFSKGEYTQCVELFSQLVSNHPQDPNYNFKYGTCLLFSTEDKEQAIRFLKFAINKGGEVEPEAYFFYGRALHLNYQFSKAKAQYIKFRSTVKPKVSAKKGIVAYITQCSSAERLIDDIQQINVVHKKKVNKSEFFRSYRLGSMKRNIIVKPEEFQTKEDKKANEYSLIVHNPMNEVIYVSGYNKKDGMGGKDIFKIQKMPDGTFSEPINVGPSINTAQDEDFPYLHPNGRVLYFASKGHNSIGGYDVFRSELDTLLNLWGNAVNVGFAVNSPDDDVLYVSDMDENIAYFASSRENKQGEITVYKILPNNSNVPAVIVQGEILIKGSTQNKAKVVVYDEEGEEVGVYTSQQQSGAFTMTLEESTTFSIGIRAPGKPEEKVTLIVPAKADESIISKKFVIENGKLSLVDNSALLANAEYKKKIIAESARLNVNQSKDVEFNTKIEKKEIKTTPVVDEVADVETDVVDEAIDLTASAQEELDEITAAEKKIKKQIDATYFVAQKKKIKSNLIKDEIEELSEELADAYSESDKKIKRDEITKKQKDLRVNTTEAVSALEVAQVKEKELRIKAKERESAEAYLNAVKKAEKSGNSSASIAALEKARDNLDVIQEDIKRMKEDDGSAKTFAKIDAAKKNVADKELALDIVETDISDIKREKKDLLDQAESTRNKGLKEELKLQVKELDQESKYKVVEQDVAKAALTEARSELDVLESSKNIFAEINEEAEDEGLVMMSETQKTKIQEEVAFVEQEAEANKKKTEQDRIAKEKAEKDRIKAIEAEQLALSVKTNSVDEINEEIDKVTKAGEVTNEEQYSDELKKAEIKKQELASIREEKDLMELSLNGPGSSREKKSIQKKIDELATQEVEAIKEIRTYVDKAKEQEEILTEEEKSANSEKIEALASLEETIVEIEKVQEEEELLVTETETETGSEVSSEEEIVVDEVPEVATEKIVVDVETATDNEIDNIVSNQTKIRSYDFSTDNNWDGVEDKIDEISKLKKEAIELLKESNIAQIESEKKGGKSSSSADKLKEKAIEKLFDASEIEGEIHAKEFSANREILEKEIFKNKDMSTDQLKNKAKEVSDLWTKASVRRAIADESKDETERVKLINEAGELEKAALDAQKELSLDIDSRKEVVALLESEKLAEAEKEAIAIAQTKAIAEKAAMTLAQEKADELAVQELADAQASATASVEGSTETSVEGSTETSVEGSTETSVEGSTETSVEGSTETKEINTQLTDVTPKGTSAETQNTELTSTGSKNGDSESTTSETGSTSEASNQTTQRSNLTSEQTATPSTSKNNVDLTSYDKENPSKKAIASGNEVGYGIKRERGFEYGPSSKTKLELAAAEKLENEAVDYYYQAAALKEKANDNPYDAKKLNKEAGKLLKKGKKVQDEANIQYQKVNAAEIKYNDDEIAFSLENDDIVKSDSAKLIVREANKIFDKALAIRKTASKEKDSNKSSELINEAYQLELKAIEKQNYVLSGELDGEEETEFEDVVVNTVKEEENEYTKKAANLRVLADEESNESKKQTLFVEARRYQLAGNTKRTKRMQNELTADKIVYENNTNFIKTARKQSNNNTPANKAYDLELEADSLFALAEAVRIKSSNNSDQVSRIEQIEESKELMAEAKETQASAVRKYQESKSAPDEPNFIAKFRDEQEEEVIANTGTTDPAVEIEKPEEITSVVEEEEVPVEVVEIIEEIPIEIAIEEEEVVETETVQVNVKQVSTEETNTTVVEEVVRETEITEEVAVTQNSVEETGTSSKGISAPAGVQMVKDSYKSLTVDAKTIEMQEVARVERIEVLKIQSIDNKNKSEELLSTVDAMEDENEIMQTIAKANTYRNKGEAEEVEAKNEEIILKNNIAEGAAMRREAELILDGLRPDIKKDILAEEENSSPELKKIQEFLAQESVDVASVDPIVNVDPVDNTPIDNIAVDNSSVDNNTDENNSTPVDLVSTSSPTKPNLEGASILGEGTVEELQAEDEFVLNTQKTYSTNDVIPVNNEMPKGIIYQVQVGAFRNKIDPSIFNGLSPLVGEKTSSGIIRYKVGYFRGFKSANMAKGRIRNLGYRDAFVVVFFDGQRITIPDAQYVIDNADESEKFVYENLVMDEVQKLKQLGITEEEATDDPVDISTSPVLASNSVNTSPTVSGDNGLENDLLNVGGVFFTVQVGVFRSPRVSSDLHGVSPLLTEKLNNGLLRYTTGVYRNYVSADSRKVAVRNEGVKDAFVIAYNGRNKISTTSAKSLSDNDDTNTTTENSTTTSADIVFKVQVGAYRAPIVLENTPVFKDLTAYPISSITRPSGLLIYMAGSYKSKSEANDFRQVVRAAGGADCFVVALQNGKRIPMKTALEILKNQ